MLGNILYGSYIYGNKFLGVFTAEAGSAMSLSTVRQLTRGRATFSSFPEKPRDWEKDREISFEDNNQSIPRGASRVYGNFDEFGSELVGRSVVTGYATFIAPEIIATGYGPIYHNGYAEFNIDFVDDNTVMWSDIGSLSFTKTQSNMAGQTPMEWRGYVFQIAKLGLNNVFVYGENGITKLIPAGIFYGQETLLDLGLKNKLAFCQSKKEHYFILNDDSFCKLNTKEGIVKLGYKEFMSTLTNPILSYDNKNDNVYICDGTNGYLYSVANESMCKGEAEVTGVLYQDNVMRLFTLSDTTSLGDFELCTDSYDLGTRKKKTIFNIEVGTNYEGTLQCAIDYRNNKNDDFTTIPYMTINPDGVAEIPCVGVELRFRLKATLDSTVGVPPGIDTFKIDYIKVNGVVHGFSFLDTVTMK